MSVNEKSFKHSFYTCFKLHINHLEIFTSTHIDSNGYCVPKTDLKISDALIQTIIK